MTDRRHGFTLIETIIVLVVIGIVFGVLIPRIERLSPKYAMRAAARELTSNLEYVRSTAVIRNMTYAVVYDLGRKRYTICVPPEKSGVDAPFEEWERLEPTELPALVAFQSIVLADNMEKRARDSDEVVIFFDPVGALGSHVAVLEDTDGHVLSVKFNSLTGTVDFVEGVVGFARYE
jgi:prepilin-type N-terminal cleavage/methylation domain-containing protein